MSWKELKKQKSKLSLEGCGGYYIIPVAIARSSLSDTSKKVLSYIISLWGCFDKVYPSIDKIMETTFSSRRAVHTALKELSQLGLVTIQYSVGRGNANTYQVNEKEVNNFLGMELFINDVPAAEEPKNNRRKLN